MPYDVLDIAPCRYGVLVVNDRAELRDIVEKPEFLICSDGYQRVRDKTGNIIDMMTQKMRLST